MLFRSIVALTIAVKPMGCRVYGSDQKIYIRNHYGYYPDVTVMCGDPQLAFAEALQNPLLLAEVLSPSTEKKDRTTKWAQYQTIATLQHYVMIDQYKPHVDYYGRGDNNEWLPVRTFTALSDTWQFVVGDKAVTIPLSEIYDLVTFDDAPDDEN